ncbi:MAG: hypothetical protein N2489_03295 [Clostridia bacterium]|nr:hypothetical protein [Clostridia bacterium]
MQCKDCKYVAKKEILSLLSQMMGYTAECTKTGTMFNLEQTSDQPLWCPLREEEKETPYSTHGE